jgi:hypothetical protein
MTFNQDRMMSINQDRIIEKRIALQNAKEVLDPIVEQHGLDDFKNVTNAFSNNVQTKVQQHLDHIITLADWFLDS